MGLIIQQGQASDLGIPFWEIVDAAGNRMTEFDHRAFDHIFAGAFVYFVDLDLDPRFCENVQSRNDVDNRFGLALPVNGCTPDAEIRLRLYIMAALLQSLQYNGQDRSNYLARLDAVLISVKAAAENAPNGRLTINVLKSQEIVE